MKIIFPFLALIMLFGCSRKDADTGATPLNKFQDRTIRHIYDLQDRRASDSLIAYFTNAEPVYRMEAAYAFASVQDTLAIPMLGQLLNDKEPSVRKAAAYALGQTKDSSAEEYMLRAIGNEAEPAVMAEMLESLGKCCGRKGLRLLSEMDTRDSASMAGQLWGLFRAANRSMIHPAAAGKAVSRLRQENPYSVRLAAAFFLGRARGLDLSPFANEIEHAIQAEQAYDVRMMEVSALAKVKPLNAGLLCTLSGGDPDHRVRINAIRAMRAADYSQVSHHLFRALKDKNVNVAIASAEFILDNDTTDDSGLLLQKAVENPNWRVSSLLLSAAMKVAKDKKQVNEYLRAQYRKSTNPYEKAALLLSMGQDVNNYTFIETETFGAEHVAISTNGIEALVNIRKSAGFRKEWEQQFFRIFMRAVHSGDVAMVGTVATAMRDTALNFKKLYAGHLFLDSAMAKLSIPRDIETRIEIQRTLGYLRGQERKKQDPIAWNHQVNWERVAAIPQSQRVLIKTSKGNIRLHLFVDAAPGSVSAFTELAEKGFYNSKAIHRVVPNFVAQDGCPRGDGWGGTDFSLRSEFAPLHYLEGFVGLASAGKDTESCQWFITHSPAPHLDGNYTIIGKVVEGMDIVQLLEIGDLIESIEVVK